MCGCSRNAVLQDREVNYGGGGVAVSHLAAIPFVRIEMSETRLQSQVIVYFASFNQVYYVYLNFS